MGRIWFKWVAFLIGGVLNIITSILSSYSNIWHGWHEIVGWIIVTLFIAGDLIESYEVEHG